MPLNGLPKKEIVERLLTADVIYAIGGSVYHLARSIEKNDLTDDFNKLLEEKVYVGSSAGSMIFSRHLNRRSADVFDETNDPYVLARIKQRTKEIIKERKEELKKSTQRFKIIRDEIDKWPEWKKKCNFFKIIKKEDN